MEWLGKALNNAIMDGMLMSYHTRRRAITISHLLYADDIIIFTNGDAENMRFLLEIIHAFCGLSGQILNAEKSAIYFSKRMSVQAIEQVLEITRFKKEQLPFMYLGSPIYKGRTLITHFSHLEDRVTSRIQGWSGKFLSMAGKIVLVNSVLNTLAIHNMMVLPIPVTVLDRIASRMANFIWNSGGAKRRHWVAWDKLCRPRRAGGFGIRQPRDIMLAMHGKLAWSYVSGNSLWARYSRSRFEGGSQGSPIWNSIVHLIPTMREGGIWRIGRGLITVQEYCYRMGVVAPNPIKRESIKHVLSSSGQRAMLEDVIPLYAREALLNTQALDYDDCFIWRGTSDGLFTTKAFFDSYQTRYATSPWADTIWKVGIPPKISVFIWRLFHNVLPTEDNVRKCGIHLASMCKCCTTSPSIESVNHLFFQGDWAASYWRYIGRLLDRPRPHGIQGLVQSWFQISSPWDRFILGVVCCGLWEVWRQRNARLHDERYGSMKLKMRKWCMRLWFSTKMKGDITFYISSTLAAMGIRCAISSQRLQSSWSLWQPGPRGTTINIGTLVKPGSIIGGVIARNSSGRFLFAQILNLNHGPPINLILQCLRSCRVLVDDQVQVQSSNSGMSLLTCKECYTPLDMIHLRRYCFEVFADVSFVRVCPAKNTSVCALVCIAEPGLFQEFGNLPTVVRKLLSTDRIGIPHCCSSSCSFGWPDSIMDDNRVASRSPFPFSRFNDDSAL